MIDFGFSIDLDITDRFTGRARQNFTNIKKILEKNEIVVTQA